MLLLSDGIVLRQIFPTICLLCVDDTLIDKVYLLLQCHSLALHFGDLLFLLPPRYLFVILHETATNLETVPFSDHLVEVILERVLLLLLLFAIMRMLSRGFAYSLQLTLLLLNNNVAPLNQLMTLQLNTDVLQQQFVKELLALRPFLFKPLTEVFLEQVWNFLTPTVLLSLLK